MAATGKVKVLARGWEVAIHTGTTVYAAIGGLTSLTFDGEKSDADTTSFDNDGWKTHLPASRGRKLSAGGFFLEDQGDKSRDAGQAAVEALAEEVGNAGLSTFRLTSPGGTIQYFEASANVSGIGGGNDDATGWSMELVVSGELTDINPHAV